MVKIRLTAQGDVHGSGLDLRTDHLRPVIEYLLAQGNRPAHWWHEDGWRSDPGGELHYAFTDPIDAAQVRERFTFPASIRVYDNGSIKDSLNRVNISQESPGLLFSFEGLPATTDPIQSPQTTLELPAADDGIADEQLRRGSFSNGT